MNPAPPRCPARRRDTAAPLPGRHLHPSLTRTRKKNMTAAMIGPERPKRMPTAMNGVDTPALMTTINTVSAQPELAQFQFRARNRWVAGTHSQSTMQGYFGAGAEQERGKPHRADGDHPAV